MNATIDGVEHAGLSVFLRHDEYEPEKSDS